MVRVPVQQTCTFRAALFLATLVLAMSLDCMSVEPEPGEFGEANYSPTDSALYRAIRRVTAAYFPQVRVVPRLTSGYTECQRYRPLGIQAYGFATYTATDAEGSTEHGNDERIRVGGSAARPASSL